VDPVYWRCRSSENPSTGFPATFPMDEFYDLVSDTDGRIRSRAVAQRKIDAGARILRDTARATALLPSEKGTRCDWCMQLLQGQVDNRKPQRCSRCTVYYYCGTECTSCDHWSEHFTKVGRDYLKAKMLTGLLEDIKDSAKRSTSG
jgi:hypothetical protein